MPDTLGYCQWCDCYAIVEVNGIRGCQMHLDLAFADALAPLYDAMAELGSEARGRPIETVYLPGDEAALSAEQGTGGTHPHPTAPEPSERPLRRA